MKAIVIRKHGGPEVLGCEEIAAPTPGPGEVRLRLYAAGVNYIDTYHRRGLYGQALPFTPGMEGAGIVDALGESVTDVALGDRVAYAMQLGSYAEYAVVPAWSLVKVPDEIEIETAAALLLQGMTAHYLVKSTYALQEGDRALIHAAAGGMGLLLVQMAKLSGALVLGTTSTTEKAELARKYGADHVIRYTEENFVEATLDLTGGKGVNVVYDGVGQTTFLKGLDCLAPRGYMVLYGQASGPVSPLDPQVLNQKGSLFLTRPSLGHYAASAQEIQQRTQDIFAWILSGELKVRIDRSFALCDAAEAHRYIEGRNTKGKLLLGTGRNSTTADRTIDTHDRVDEGSWESFPASDPPPY